jgi:hypothetical protein
MAIYRDGWDAAVARVHSLERELALANHARVSDRERMVRLEKALAEARAALAFVPSSALTPPELRPSSATAAMVIGILSIVICQVLGPVAWAMSAAELRRIDNGFANPLKRGQAQTGMVLGIVATVMLCVAAIGFMTMLSDGLQPTIR